MKKLRFLMVIFAVAAVSSIAMAVETFHLEGAGVTSTSYVRADDEVFMTGLNSPMHESWNLVDKYIGGELNPHYLGDYTANPQYNGWCYRIITYHKSELLIDAGGKVGVRDTLWTGGNGSNAHSDPQGEYGTLVVRGELLVNKLRHWKTATAVGFAPGMSYHEVRDNGILDVNDWWVGVYDGNYNNVHALVTDNGLAKINQLNFYTGCDDSFLDITGGEVLVKSARMYNRDPNFIYTADVQDLIDDGRIICSLGYDLIVTQKNVGGVDYTSITIPEPATMALLSSWGLIMLRRKK